MEKSYKFTHEYSCKKAGELRAKLSGALPDVAARAGMSLHLVEQYLSGKKVMTERIYRKLQDAVAWASVKVVPPQVDWSKVQVPEDGLEEFVYQSGHSGNRALIVRFSEDEWSQVQELFPSDADIEGAVRSFVLKVLDTDEKRSLYCPQTAQSMYSWGENLKEGKAFYETENLRVAVDFAEYVKGRISQVLGWASVSPEKFFGQLIDQTLYGPEPEDIENWDELDNGSIDESLSLRVWRARALEAEARADEAEGKLRKIHRDSQVE